VEEFLKDASRQAAQLVEDLLQSPGFARHFASQWAEVLVGSGTATTSGLRSEPLPAVDGASDRTGAPTARGDRRAHGAGHGYTNPPSTSPAEGPQPNDLAGAVSKAFLGVQIQCAQCHDHPYED